MKILTSLLFLALSLGANLNAQPICQAFGLDCTTTFDGCNACHNVVQDCQPIGCIDCNTLCYPIIWSNMTKEQRQVLTAKSRERALQQAKLNPYRLNDAGKLWDIITAHLESLNPKPTKTMASYRLPQGHPSILTTVKPDPAKCAAIALTKLKLHPDSLR